MTEPDARARAIAERMPFSCDTREWYLARVADMAAEIAAALHAAYQAGLEEAAQEFYNVTTWLISVSPTGRIDLGATQDYHDALVALTELRRKLRDAGTVTHDESYWLRARAEEHKANG